jgi:hypothetical protein
MDVKHEDDETLVTIRVLPNATQEELDASIARLERDGVPYEAVMDAGAPSLEFPGQPGSARP